MNLHDKQSVRTTFKLSKEGIDDLEWITATYGIKPKELFDIICSNDTLFETVTNELSRSEDKSQKDTQRKTYVISRIAKSKLTETSSKKGISRDMLTDFLIRLHKRMLEDFLEKEKEGEEKAYKLISELVEILENKESEIKELISEDNPIINRMGLLVTVAHNLLNEVEDKIENNTPVDPDSM